MDLGFAAYFPRTFSGAEFADYARDYVQRHPAWITRNGKIHDLHGESHSLAAYQAGARGPGITEDDGYEINKQVIKQHQLVRAQAERGEASVTVGHAHTIQQRSALNAIANTVRKSGHAFYWECADHKGIPDDGISYHGPHGSDLLSLNQHLDEVVEK